ncbi:HEPN domain-containing protein [Aestuariirhabdus sp. Z084]|uniref:HEPN domain-containing protein n=1 Tax=Aestuariirhabdus haliotis TaxID=2918751 RepID=UPI00201B42A5|nr:HEPN domain-containing protein [Aestuariirhabdus haliotis]MCL6420437.1 HEPN domain-containing protein [Aestuariirhabdus haliotis]
MFKEADTPDVFPSKVLVCASEKLLNSANKKDIWALSGDGWKSVLADHRKEVISRFIGKLNTPRQSQVDELFLQLIGLKSISSSWHWKGKTKKKAVESLSNLITLRGSIAHRVKTSKSVTKSEVERNIQICMRLSVLSSNACAIYLQKSTGKYPWNRFTYKATG